MLLSWFEIVFEMVVILFVLFVLKDMKDMLFFKYHADSWPSWCTLTVEAQTRTSWPCKQQIRWCSQNSVLGSKSIRALL